MSPYVDLAPVFTALARRTSRSVSVGGDIVPIPAYPRCPISAPSTVDCPASEKTGRGDLRLAEDGGDDEEGATPRPAQGGLEFHLRTGGVQSRADTEPQPGACMKRAWMANSSRDELLQPLLEVCAQALSTACREPGARSAQDRRSSTRSFPHPARWVVHSSECGTPKGRLHQTVRPA
jgi:hypothetical protein